MSRAPKSTCVLVLALVWASCGGESEPAPEWPASPAASSVLSPLRGQRYVRGIIHAHSTYSHDACDGHPVAADGTPNAECRSQLRFGICQNLEDFIFLTDHRDSLAEEDDFSKLLLHDAAAGDELVVRGDEPVANWIACPDGTSVLLLTGHEDAMMPVGMERHYPGTAAERSAFYGRRDPEAVQISRDELGAVVLQNHTEEHTVEDLLALGLDGVEVYNIHAALLPGTRQNYLGVSGSGGLEGMLPFFDFHEETWPTAPEPDLAILGLLEDFAVYNQLWDGLLEHGRMVGVLASDVHQNVYPFVLKDGDRGDSFRRMMRFYNNYLLVPEGEELTPELLKEALRQGRLAGVFEILGTPEGLDFHAEAGGGVYEMGDEVTLAESPTLVAVAPTVYGLGPDDPAPELAMHLVCAGEEVASGTDRIDYAPDAPGACRLDVTIVPWHLEQFLGTETHLAGQIFPWVKANPIYVN